MQTKTLFPTCRRLRYVALVLLIVGCKTTKSTDPSLTGITPTTHRFFPITDGPHAVDCTNCHAPTDTFAQFSCVGCHTHDQSITDRLHPTVTQYSFNSAGCYSCHPDGSRQSFDHPGIAQGCATCHDIGGPFAALPIAGFTHPVTNGADCSACHSSTTTWKTNGAPSVAFDPAQTISVDALIPSYADTSITSFSPQTEALVMPMNHNSTQVVPDALVACANCHSDATTGVYYPGIFHSSLANLMLQQPTSCSDCHTSSMPVGFVGPTATSPVRNPPSGEMKHDAVEWLNGAPTATAVVPTECGICHQSPSQNLQATWATNLSGTTPVAFHSSLVAASQTQPASCLDCHANTRPTSVLTSANASLPPNLQFDHTSPASLDDCASCHSNKSPTEWTSWAGGRFHLAGSASPSTCLPCHASERPTTTSNWSSSTFTASPFDYVPNSRGITHGDGQDCALCHGGPGTGAWGTNQNWVGGHYSHDSLSVAGTTCIACHMTQRPDLQSGTNASTMASLLGFDHSLNGTGDCFGCHQATVTANHYVNYANPGTHQLPGGDWAGGQSYPGSTLIGAADQFVTITEITLQKSGPNNLVTGTTSTLATLYNEMLHISLALPTELNAGPSGSPDNSKCWHCHTNNNGVVTAFAGGEFHSSLSNYTATPGGTLAPFPQPTTLCTDCHTQMRPVGIVEKSASDLQPMDHNAGFKSAVTLGGSSVTGVAQMQCAICHHSPGNTWSDGVFHSNIGAAVPQDCTLCHYPLLADTAKSDLKSSTNYQMRHASTQITFQNCQTCHTGALAKGATTPIASTLWQGGVYHPSLATQPTACLDCHAVSEPAANSSTQSSVTYALAQGGTAGNGAQWMNHGQSDVVGKDCAICHAADAKTSGSAWLKGDSFHSHVAKPASCQTCHGLSNGGGAAIGTNNNLPTGLTSSSMVSTAGGDPTTGVTAGTNDQIDHSDVNISSHDCNFCHTQSGPSGTSGIQGKEWAQASFHSSFTSANPIVINGTTGRCSNCHMNVKPGTSFGGQDHSSFTNTSGSQDCSACHSWPGTGTAAAPNWLGASGGTPVYINVGGFAISQPPATTATTQGGIANLPHPTVGTNPCTACHTTSAGGTMAIGYDHASTLINSNCKSCHEAGSNLVGTVWNNATSETAGAGDTRPWSAQPIQAHYSGNTHAVNNTLNHFYPVDCHECHVTPTGISKVTTGSSYIVPGSNTAGAWRFPHTEKSMSNPSTCNMCHGAPNNIPKG